MAKSMKCPNCDSPNLVLGTLQSTGSVHFRPAETKFLTFRTADIAVRSAMCGGCGHVTLIGDRQKLMLLFPTLDGSQSERLETASAR